MKPLTVGALFAGYGGLEMGLGSVLDIELAWYAEFDKKASLIGAHHHPGVPNLGDVTKVDWASVPRVQIITGGSPCQDLSHAGKRKGMTDGTRSNLWVEMREAIAVIRPSLVVWENVRGALSAPADSDLEPCQGCVGDADEGPVLRALGRVLGDLAELGYDARWYGLRAADVGAPHGRFRVFLFAVPTDADDEGLEGLPGAPRASSAGRHGHFEPGTGRPDLTLLPTPAVNDMGASYTPDEWDDWADRMKTEHGNGNGHGKSLAIEAQRLLPTPRTSDTNGAGSHGMGGPDLRTVAALLPTPRATDGTKGGPNQRGSSGDLMLPSAVGRLLPTPSVADGMGGHLSRSGARSDELLLPGVAKDLAGRLLPTPTAHVHPASDTRDPFARIKSTHQTELSDVARTLPQPTQDWAQYEPAIRRWEHVLGRPAPAPTEPGAKGQPRLSPRFVEWMMGLPEGHVTDVPGLTRNDQLKALGNGVVPQQCAAAARAFLKDTARVIA